MLTRARVAGYMSLRDAEARLEVLIMLFETNATGKSSVLDAPRQMSNPGTSRAVKEAFNLPHRDTPINSFSVGNRGLKGLIKRKRAYSNKANPMKRLTHVRAIDMRLNWRDASSGCKTAALKMNLVGNAHVDRSYWRFVDRVGSDLQGGGRS